MVILERMTHRVGPKGQVVIPKEIRDRLGISPGDTVVFQDTGDGVIVRRAIELDDLVGILRGDGGALSDYEAQKRDEREMERQRERAWGCPPLPGEQG